MSYLTLINSMNLSLGKKSSKHSKQHQPTKLWELIALIQAIYSMNQLLASLFTSLITVLRMVHVCPSAWRKAVIFPIPKSGMSNKHVPGNYRGISLQSAVLNLYTSILNRRLLFLLERYEVISDLQNGFRPHRTCQDHILSLHNIVLNCKLRGNDTYACFVDFKKAFDSIVEKTFIIWNKRTISRRSHKHK